jgi:hypothetical protein
MTVRSLQRRGPDRCRLLSMPRLGSERDDEDVWPRAERGDRAPGRKRPRQKRNAILAMALAKYLRAPQHLVRDLRLRHGRQAGRTLGGQQARAERRSRPRTRAPWSKSRHSPPPSPGPRTSSRAYSAAVQRRQGGPTASTSATLSAAPSVTVTRWGPARGGGTRPGGGAARGSTPSARPAQRRDPAGVAHHHRLVNLVDLVSRMGEGVGSRPCS